MPYDPVEKRIVCVARIRAKNPQDIFEYHRSRTGEELDPKTMKRPELKDAMGLYLEDPEGLITLKIDRFLYPKYKEELWDAQAGHDYCLFVADKYPFPGKNLKASSVWIIDPD